MEFLGLQPVCSKVVINNKVIEQVSKFNSWNEKYKF